jgi:uncharacterized membrane protein
MKIKQSFLTIASIYFSGINFLNVIRNYKITYRLNKIPITALILYSSNGYCCINCNKEVQKAISESIYTNIFVMFSAFIVLILTILLLIYFSVKNYNIVSNQHTNLNKIVSVPLISASMVLGIGIGGFADGIIFHQILQWHEMLSNKFPPNTLVQKSMNMFWDGIFHLFTLLTAIVGIYLLWRLFKKNNINTSGYLLTGGMLAGWGVFNLIEGIINHHILKIHNVRELIPNKDLWNYGFLFFGIFLLIMGWFIIQKGKKNKNTRVNITKHF